MKILIFGAARGWIGGKLMALVRAGGDLAIIGKSRLEERESLAKEIEAVCPDLIFNAAGVTGEPNVDWCNDHQIETIRSNLVGALNLFDIANNFRIHLTNFGTGCIYEYDEYHPEGSSIGFKEEEPPNFIGSFYSKTKAMLDELVKSYPAILNLRLRMPLSSDLHPRNFIAKIIKYEKVVDIPNSMTVLDELLPVAIVMAKNRFVGTYNFTNPGTISHNEILSLYRDYIDSSFSWRNFSSEELMKVCKAQRSNNELDVSKLLSHFPTISPIQESVRSLFKKMACSLPRD